MTSMDTAVGACSDRLDAAAGLCSFAFLTSFLLPVSLKILIAAKVCVK